ncbi:hypothetical protein D3C77_434630 [compost metagenome]
MLRISNRSASFATQIATILPGELPGSLHSALPAFACAAFTAEQGQAVVQVRSAATQDIALAQ